MTNGMLDHQAWHHATEEIAGRSLGIRPPSRGDECELSHRDEDLTRYQAAGRRFVTLLEIILGTQQP
jgi:hypothetical protein